ncbi:MAG TPA: TMEM175 family protein [Puia sp.]|nr:TMEM175 family protein [Puia sp.]
MIRETLFKTHEHPTHGFRLRGHEVKRIETFTDAVFAFAVTLLIVSLEVPRNFEDLMISMRGFFAFAACFALLMLVWHEQHVFFRRYALDDPWTVVLNCILIFIVLFYVYPLKFLFSLWFSPMIYPAGKNPFSIRNDQVPLLFGVFGIGFVIIYSIFFFLYWRALKKKGHLQLSTLEVFDTKTKVYAQLMMVGIGIGALIIALATPIRIAVFSGMFYFVIGPAYMLLYGRRAVLRKRIKS